MVRWSGGSRRHAGDELPQRRAAVLGGEGLRVTGMLERGARGVEAHKEHDARVGEAGGAMPGSGRLGGSQRLLAPVAPLRSRPAGSWAAEVADRGGVEERATEECTAEEARGQRS